MFKVHRSFDLSTGVKNNSIAVVNEGGEIRVIYHETCVVHVKGSKITLANGGWDTVSTRLVINRALQALGLHGSFLFTKKKVTYLNHEGVKEFHGCEVIKAARKAA